MKKILALLLATICAPAAAQNYLRDDGIFHSVVEGTSTGQVLVNSGGLLAGVSPSTSGKVLTSAGPASIPTFQFPVTDGVINVDTCGAVGDGVADDAPAIRTCAAQVSAAGGGAVGFSCDKTYLLASKYTVAGAGYTFLLPYSNVSYQGCGDSSVLKIAANMNTASTQFSVIYPPDETATYTINNFRVKDLKIDFNGANNSGGGTLYYQNVGVGVRYGDTVVVDNVTFLNNPGSQDVSFGLNSGLTVNRVVVRSSRSYDSCDAVNVACTDHSAFYAVATQFSVLGNICKQTSESIAVTCIEMHGVDVSAVGNTDYNVNHSVNIAAQLGHTVNSAVVTGHTSYGADKGIILFALDTKTFNNVNISGNTWRRRATINNNSIGFIDLDLFVTSAGTTNLIFANNIIDGSAITAGTANVTPVITLGRTAAVVISGNTITGNSGECIGAGTLTAASSVTIRDNTLIDCGQTSTAANRRGILIPASGTAASLNISGNRVANVASTYMTVGIDVALNVSSGFIAPNNRIEGVASGVSITGTGYFPTTTFGLVWSSGQGLPYQTTAALTDGQIAVGQTSAAILPKTLSGDATLAASGALTLASTIAAGGPTGSATVAPIITYDAKGRLTAVSSATIAPAQASIVWSGTSGGIPYYNSTSTIASSALLAANALVIGGGAGAAPSTTTTGTNVLAALAVNVGSAGAFVTFNGALGTPSSGTVTNLTGTASININGTVGATTPTTGKFTTLVAGGTDNTGIDVVNGSSSVRTFLRYNASAGGYIGVMASGGGASIQMLGTGGGYYAPMITFGSAAAATGSSGEVAVTKMTASGTAPGAGFCKIFAEAGTTGGTCRLSAYCGTSTTKKTILDDIGAGC